MKRKFFALLAALSLSVGMMAQSAADKIVGTYKVLQNGTESKVKIFKHDGGYRAQVCWLKEPKNPDGTLKTDHKNPDASKRSTPSDKIVVVDKVFYKDGMWKDGRIYDPTSGKTYKVEIKFKDDNKTLEVKGKLGPFFERVYWTKLQ